MYAELLMRNVFIGYTILNIVAATVSFLNPVDKGALALVMTFCALAVFSAFLVWYFHRSARKMTEEKTKLL